MSVKYESASGIGKARGCLRKWTWGYIDGIWPPPTEENTRGTRIHAMMEAYLKHGTLPTANDIETQLFRLALPHLPHPGIAEIERKTRLRIDGIDYVVVIDMAWCDGTTIHLYDHKTSKWAPRFILKSRENYLDDPQFVLYAHALFQMYPDAIEVEGKWVYYKVPKEDDDLAKFKPKVYAHPHIFTRSAIADVFTRIVQPTAQKLVQIRTKGLRAADVPGNMDHCSEYGGCFYLSRCQKLESENMASTVSLDDLFGEFEKPAAVPPAKKPDEINAPEKIKTAEPAPAVEVRMPGVIEKPAVALQHPEYYPIAHDLFRVCEGLNSSETLRVLKDLARKLLG